MATAAPAKPLVKREPAVILTGVATIISTLFFVAPNLGVPIPGTVQKIVAAALTLAAGFGIRPQVKPV